MKKIITLASVSLLLSAGVFAQQNKKSNEETIRDNAAVAKNEEMQVKSDIKSDKKDLRKLEGKEASYQAKQAFYRDFGTLKVIRWRRTPEYDQATYRDKDGTVHDAYYDYDADLIGTSTLKTFSDLPESAQNWINKEYSGYKHKEVLFFKDNEYNDTNMTLYGMAFDDADNYFVELQKGHHKVVLQVDPEGLVTFFATLK